VITSAVISLAMANAGCTSDDSVGLTDRAAFIAGIL
jgi:hypothetical protein